MVQEREERAGVQTEKVFLYLGMGWGEKGSLYKLHFPGEEKEEEAFFHEWTGPSLSVGQVYQILRSRPTLS